MRAQTRDRLQCPVCGDPFWTPRNSPALTCSETCRRLRQAVTISATQSRKHGETPDAINAKLAEVRAARLARERATGQRTFTLSAMDARAQRGPSPYSAGAME